MRSLPLALVGIGLAVLLAPAGCAPAADPGWEGSGNTATGATGGGGSAGASAGTAGSATAGMSAGGIGAAGSGPAGAAGNATAGSGAAGNGAAGNGAAGSGSGGAGIDPGCDYVPLLVMDCAHAGCHAPMPGVTAAASLNLLPDSGLVARLKDVKAQHLNINCAPPGEDIVECGYVPAACPSDALLVSSASWEASWVIAKLRGTAVGCGDIMRDATYLTEKPDREACVEAVVRAIAALPRASVAP